MKKKEFEKRFKKISTETLAPYLPREANEKLVRESSDSDGRVSDSELAIRLSIRSMEYTTKLIHDLLKEFIVDKK